MKRAKSGTEREPDAQANAAAGDGGTGAGVWSATKERIGEMLFAAGLISRANLERATALHREQGGELIDILFSTGCIEPNTFLDFLLKHFMTNGGASNPFDLSPELIASIPAESARRYEAVPIERTDDLLVLATAAALPPEAMQDLERASGLHVKAVICQGDAVRSALTRYYPDSEALAAEQPQRAAEGIEGTLKLSRVAHLVRQITSLPALPETVTQVRSAVQDPRSSVKEIADIITLDPPIAAKVLSVANSAAYGFSRRIHDLNLAISLMGLRETYTIVLSCAVADFARKLKRFDYRTFWLESVCCAAASRIAAKACGRRNLDGLFSAGLLHDIGRVALWETAPELCAKLDKKLSGLELIAAEEQLVGLSHTEAGYELAERWGLPVEIAEPIRFHHIPGHASEARENVAIIALADRMAGAAGTRIEDNRAVFAGLEAALELLRVDDELAEAMLSEYLSKREAAVREAFDD